MCSGCDSPYAPRISQLNAEEEGLLDERSRLFAALDRARTLINRRYAPLGLGYLDSQIAAIDRRLRQIAWERQSAQMPLQRRDYYPFADDDAFGPVGWR
jgi:hypothetical protein